MIRPLTLLTMILAAVSGAYMFAVKHRAQVLDNQLASVAQQTRLDQERIRVLQAQWALETAPPRVKQLAAQFTDLQPLKPSQLMTEATLATVLPPPGKVAPATNPAQPPPAVVAEASIPAPSVAAKAPSPPAPAVPNVLAVAASPIAPKSAPSSPKPTPPAKLAAVVAHHAASQPHQVVLTARVTSHPVVSHLASTQVADSLPPPRPVHSLYALPPQSAYMPAHPTLSSAQGGSSLAMAADLPPPKPLAGSESNN
ncbi:MAG: hypothetical protein B7W99_01110 [Rhodospirillales bacterium 20-58-10]|nr:MAG: hypothetical protein B7W99_01110 [Rhodospirillales bacterium 20-58-10]